jgi:hypothetical protein
MLCLAVVSEFRLIIMVQASRLRRAATAGPTMSPRPPRPTAPAAAGARGGGGSEGSGGGHSECRVFNAKRAIVSDAGRRLPTAERAHRWIASRLRVYVV